MEEMSPTDGRCVEFGLADSDFTDRVMKVKVKGVKLKNFEFHVVSDFKHKAERGSAGAR